ncbi:MAG: hypothetical protein LBN29_03740, partial [Mediterranea sp.]|nr:hypothetical protein [Mediterranea sp.]
KPEDFIAWTGEATTTNRHYYALPPGATLRNWTDGDETHHLPMVMKTNTDSIPADYVVSRLANYPPTGTVTAMPIHFKRAFAQLKWVLNVNPNVYHEYVGDLDAGFYKKYQKAWTRLANVANGAAFTGSTDQSTYPWSGYAAAELPAGSFFQHTHNDAEPITSFEDSTTFIPFPTYSSAAGANQSAQIYINSMTIKNPAGDKVVTNVELPILYGEGQNMIFKPGCSYTVTSNVTKRIQWAASNIYWNGTTLTFDETPQDHDGDETTYESGLIPGLFFKWGSLIGISKASRRVYVPSTQAYGAYQQEQLSASGLWSSISYIPSNYLVDGMIPTDGQAIEGAVIENDIYNWHGDICAYITNGLWRIPNPKEFNMHGPLHTYQDLSTVVPTIGWYSPGANETWSWDHFDTTTYQDGPVPIPYTNQVVRLVTSTGETVQFPATAIMTTWGSSGGASGYWSNIEYDQYYGTSLYFDSRRAYLEHNSGDSKAEAYSIRCVKKSN